MLIDSNSKQSLFHISINRSFFFQCSFSSLLYVYTFKYSQFQSHIYLHMQSAYLENQSQKPNCSDLTQLALGVVKVEHDQEPLNQEIILNFPKKRSQAKDLKRDRMIRKHETKKTQIRSKKRDDNYTFKRAHTLLKKCCRNVGCKQLITDDLHDFSKDFFVLLLCKLQYYKVIHAVYLQFQQLAGKQLAKIFHLIQKKQEHAREHLKNVVSTILRGMRSFEEYMTGTREQAMRIIYQENLNFKRTMQLKKAMEKLKKLEQQLFIKVQTKIQE